MHPKLLLADDSVTIQRVIELTFADEEVTVVAVGDGQQAIDRVRSDRPDIVLADVGMPERDGYEVAAFIKGDPEFAHIPVLLLTGAFEPIDEARARAVGCDGVLVKPFEPQMVISRVRDLLAGNRVGAATGGSAHAVSAAPAPAAVPAGSLEDYFDRLDAALASKTCAGAKRRTAPGAVSAPAARGPGLGGGRSAIDARGSGSDGLEPRHIARSGARSWARSLSTARYQARLLNARSRSFRSLRRSQPLCPLRRRPCPRFHRSPEPGQSRSGLCRSTGRRAGAGGRLLSTASGVAARGGAGYGDRRRGRQSDRADGG